MRPNTLQDEHGTYQYPNQSFRQLKMKSQDNHSNVINARPRIGFIGFGEVTQYISKGLIKEGCENIMVYSRACADPNRKEAEEQKGKETGVILTSSFKNIITYSDIIFSSVRGNVALEIAEKAAPYIKKGMLYIDLNNTTPVVKEKSALILELNGAYFVDVGLMELPVQVGHKALMLASGNGAKELKKLMTPYGMNIKCLGDTPGKAALIKLLVNVYMKGLQGVCLEFAVSAKKAGIDMNLLLPFLIKPVESLDRALDVPFWITRATLPASRKTTEMREVIKMLTKLEIDPVMLESATERLSRTSKFELHTHFKSGTLPQDYNCIIEKIFTLSEEKGIKVA